MNRNELCGGKLIFKFCCGKLMLKGKSNSILGITYWYKCSVCGQEFTTNVKQKTCKMKKQITPNTIKEG